MVKKVGEIKAPRIVNNSNNSKNQLWNENTYKNSDEKP